MVRKIVLKIVGAVLEKLLALLKESWFSLLCFTSSDTGRIQIQVPFSFFVGSFILDGCMRDLWTCDIFCAFYLRASSQSCVELISERYYFQNLSFF